MPQLVICGFSLILGICSGVAGMLGYQKYKENQKDKTQPAENPERGPARTDKVTCE